MKKFLVVRKTDTVKVAILPNKNTDTFSFVNLTKGHICECKFDSVEEAIRDMDDRILTGKILRYVEIK